MNKQQAYTRYKEQRPFINQYEDADTTVTVNQDPNLKPIIIGLPEPPDWHTIEGFGLAPEKQMWHPPKMPKSLEMLSNERMGMTLEEIYEILSTQQNKYKEEIKWIKKQWWHRLHGYWFFDNGKPTFLCAGHYYFLFAWHIDIGLPNYRDRDRKTWISNEFFKKCTLDFAYKDKEGYAIANTDGTYDMIDKGIFLFIGILYSKGRAEGATYRAECENCNMTTLYVDGESSIQSRDDEDSKKVFTENLVKPFNRLPFIFKPLTITDSQTQSKIVFDSINQKMKGGTIASITSGIRTKITFVSGAEGKLDGRRLIFYHNDEIAKLEKGDLMRRHNIIKNCLRKQDERFGWSWYTSTVGEMTTGGGFQFKHLSDQSNFYQRNENGSTISGLVTLFVSSVEGWGKTVDKYGNSNTEEAFKKIMAERNGYLSSSPPDMIAWAESVRQNPIYYDENFISNPTENNINIYIVETRLKTVRMNPLEYIVPGYFYREDNNPDGRVLWMPTPEVDYRKAKFNLSEVLVPEKTNKKEIVNGVWSPIGEERLACGDAYRFDAGTSRSLSDGGGYVFKLRDKSIDSSDDVLTWKTYLTVCDYLYRPSTRDEYCEDMLMMCIYHNCKIYPEAVIIPIQEYFIARGYKGYLIYDTDGRGKLKPNAGYSHSTEKVYNGVRDYVERHGFREKHPRVLEQQKAIQGVAGIGKQDLFASQGGALLGVANIMNREQIEETKKKLSMNRQFKRPPVRMMQ